MHGSDALTSPLSLGRQTTRGRVLELVGSGDEMWLQEDERLVVAVAAHPKPDTVTLVTAPSDMPGVARRAQLPPVGAVLVTGGTALTRTLLSEEARLRHGFVTILAEDLDPPDRDRAAGRPSRRRGQNGGFGPMTT